MLRLILLLSLASTLPAHADVPLYWLGFLENVVSKTHGGLEPEARTLAAVCGLRASRFYDPSLPVQIVRREAEGWWFQVLDVLGRFPSSDLNCDLDVLYALLPRPWNADHIERLREGLHGENARESLRRLAQARLLKAYPLELSPEERRLTLRIDLDLAHLAMGDRPHPGHLHGADVSALLSAARVVESGTLRVLPRAVHFECAGVLSPYLLRRDEMKNFDLLVLSLQR